MSFFFSFQVSVELLYCCLKLSLLLRQLNVLHCTSAFNWFVGEVETGIVFKLVEFFFYWCRYVDGVLKLSVAILSSVCCCCCWSCCKQSCQCCYIIRRLWYCWCWSWIAWILTMWMNYHQGLLLLLLLLIFNCFIQFCLWYRRHQIHYHTKTMTITRCRSWSILRVNVSTCSKTLWFVKQNEWILAVP